METKFSFVINCTDSNNYALVCSCWKLDGEGNRIDQQSETKTQISLEETLIEQKIFIDKWL